MTVLALVFIWTLFLALVAAPLAVLIGALLSFIPGISFGAGFLAAEVTLVVFGWLNTRITGPGER